MNFTLIVALIIDDKDFLIIESIDQFYTKLIYNYFCKTKCPLQIIYKLDIFYLENTGQSPFCLTHISKNILLKIIL